MQTIQTTISEVKVYRRGAEIIRKGSAVLEQGTNTLDILGLSNGTIMDTVKVYFPAGVKMSDFSYRQGADEDSEDLPSIRIMEEMKQFQRQKEVCELQVSLWKSNGSFQGNAKPDLSEVENYINRLPERLNALYAETASIEKKISKLEKELKEAQRQEDLPVVTVILEVPEAGTYPFELRYHDVHALWNFVYEIHTEAEGPVLMKSRARISQNTGEDWKDIALSLLTKTSSGGYLPELRPSYLSIRQQVSNSYANSSFRGKGALMGAAPMQAMTMAMMDEDVAEETVQMARMETDSAEVSSEDTMTEYTLPGRKSVPTETNGIMADLQSYELSAEYETIAAPKLDTSAYLTAKVQTKDLPEDIRGTARIYLKGAYSGEMIVEPDITKETMSIPLGKAEGIQVSRTEKKHKTSDALIKNQRTVEHVYELKITNNRTVPVTVTIQDQIPVSQDKTITVELKNSDHAEAADNGILTWKPEIAPKETKVLNLAYNVIWPKDKKLTVTERQVSPSVCPECGTKVPDGQRFCPECGAKVY